MRAMIALALVSISCAACGAPSGDDDDDGVTPDAAVVPDADTSPDGSPGCGLTWRLEPRDVRSLDLLGTAPLNGDRTSRVRVGVDLGPCEEIAMPQISYTLENEYAIITMYAWVPVGADCAEPGASIDRPVELELYPDAQWHISATGLLGEITVAVASGPGNCDTSRTPCDADCDCLSGQRCLGGESGETYCATTCELDHECGGLTCNGDISDPAFVCAVTDIPECGTSDPCPPGWSCGGGACSPTFTLSQTSRHTCTCDADCDPGLRCVQPYNDADPPRCQATCATDGPWCQGPHFCGSINQDASGLAGTDAVCGWIGE